MEIRAINFLTQLPAHPSLQQMRQHFAPIGQQAAQVQSLFTKAGYDIQSLRATQPLEQLLPKGATSQQLTTFAQQFEQAASETGFKHMALGTLGASIKTPADENKNDVILQLMCGLPAVIDATD
ncbi:MAG: DUF711 family protein, partial [Cycloclasticus sp.]